MSNNHKLQKIAQTALLAALCFVSFEFLRIPLPVPGGNATALHVGNAFCVLAALLLGGWYGGFAGAIGMTIADVLSPQYILGAPKTFVLKLCIGLVVGLVAHKIAKISYSKDKKYILKWSIIASICGLAFNVIADPVAGYYYNIYILGQPAPAASIFAKFNGVATLINAIVSVILVAIIYNALRPILERAGLLYKVGKE